MADETFDGFVFCQAQRVVNLRRLPIAVLSALPELTLVGAGKHGTILLALVLENRATLAEQLQGTERDRHLNLFGFPLLPCPAIQPERTVLCPALIRTAIECTQHRSQADAV